MNRLLDELAQANCTSSVTDGILTFEDGTQYDVREAIAERDALLGALQDCVESLKRLPNVEGAFRVTCLKQAEAAIAKATS